MFYPEEGTLRSFYNILTLEKKLVQKAHEIARSIQQLLSIKSYPHMEEIESYYGDAYRIGVYGQLGSGDSTVPLRTDLLNFLQEQRKSHSTSLTFWAVFPETQDISNEDFEERLWQELFRLTGRRDVRSSWNSQVPGSVKKFCLSLQGTGLQVIGLHQNSPRSCQKFAYTTLIFSVTEEFVQMSHETEEDDTEVPEFKKRLLRQDEVIPPWIENYQGMTA